MYHQTKFGGERTSSSEGMIQSSFDYMRVVLGHWAVTRVNHYAVTCVSPLGSHLRQTIGQSPVSDRHLCQTVKQSPVSDRRAVTPSGRKLPAHGVTTHVYRAGVVRIVFDRCGLSDGRYAAPVCTRSESVR